MERRAIALTMKPSPGLQAITKNKPGLAIVLLHHNRKMDAEDPFDTVSGTLGLTGAADTILIMRRHAGSVLLHVRGRDVEESETPLQFNKDTCRWTMLGAEAAKGGGFVGATDRSSTHLRPSDPRTKRTGCLCRNYGRD